MQNDIESVKREQMVEVVRVFRRVFKASEAWHDLAEALFD